MSTLSRITALEQRLSLLEEGLTEHAAFLRSLNTMIDAELAAHRRECHESLEQIKGVLVTQLMKLTRGQPGTGARA